MRKFNLPVVWLWNTLPYKFFLIDLVVHTFIDLTISLYPTQTLWHKNFNQLWEKKVKTAWSGAGKDAPGFYLGSAKLPPELSVNVALVSIVAIAFTQSFRMNTSSPVFKPKNALQPLHDARLSLNQIWRTCRSEYRKYTWPIRCWVPLALPSEASSIPQSVQCSINEYNIEFSFVRSRSLI